ncbi:MAG: hypothetical protein JJ859_12975 [Roseicyclus sp.]|nr:hypothetical protein [Roseicyclus sp.]
MKNTKKICVLASAIIVASQLSIATAEAAATPADAQAIVGLLNDGSYVALRDYIADNPQLLDGNGALARALRDFYAQVTTLDSFGVVRLELSTIDNLFEQASIY